MLSRMPGSRFHVLWKKRDSVLDAHGLIITPDTSLAENPRLDLLVVPGGHGQDLLMKDKPSIALTW